MSIEHVIGPTFSRIRTSRWKVQKNATSKCVPTLQVAASGLYTSAARGSSALFKPSYNLTTGVQTTRLGIVARFPARSPNLTPCNLFVCLLSNKRYSPQIQTP